MNPDEIKQWNFMVMKQQADLRAIACDIAIKSQMAHDSTTGEFLKAVKEIYNFLSGGVDEQSLSLKLTQ